MSSTRRIFKRLLGVSESSIKIKVRLQWALFVTLLICKERLLHGNEIVQYLQNYKCYNVNQDHFRKPL